MKSWGIDNPEDIARELSEAYRLAGQLDDAEAIYRERLARTESDLIPALNLGEFLLERARTNTANPSLAQKQKSEGEQLLRDYLTNARKRYANDPAELEDGLIHLAEFRHRRGDFAEAEPLYREIVQSRHARLSAEDEGVISPAASLGRLLADWAWSERDLKSKIVDRAREAEKLLRECLAIRLRGTNSTHWRTADGKSRLGGALVSVAVADPALNAEARGAKLAEAESLLLEGNEALQPSSAESKYKRDSVERLVRLYEAWGKRDKVSEWQQKLETFDKTGNEPSPPEEEQKAQ